MDMKILYLDKKQFQPILEQPMDINSLDESLILSFLTGQGRQTISTCSGDLYKVVNVLMDYARLLELAVKQWELDGYHRGKYQVSAEEYRKLARKYAAGIGYNYERALERCRRKRFRQKGGDDVGEEALVLATRPNRSQNQNSTKSHIHQEA